MIKIVGFVFNDKFLSVLRCNKGKVSANILIKVCFLLKSLCGLQNLALLFHITDSFATMV